MPAREATHHHRVVAAFQTVSMLLSGDRSTTDHLRSAAVPLVNERSCEKVLQVLKRRPEAEILGGELGAESRTNEIDTP